MREILFRGKTEKGEWVYGDLLTPDQFGNGYSIADHSIASPGQNVFDVIPGTIGQYTGLTDKNGKKIFEGDIVKGSWGTIFVVFYDNSFLQFRAKPQSGVERDIDYYQGYNGFVVIGNLYDNPELLRGDTE